MTTLADIRKQYPQYADVPDDKLVAGFHAKFYADMPVDKFNAAIGYKPTLRTQTAPAPAPTPAQLAAHDAQSMAKRVYGPTQAIANGATLGASDWLNAGLDAGITGLQNLATRAQGGTPKYGMADRFNADRQAFVDQAAAHPVTNTAGGLLGGAFIPGLGKGLEAANGLVQGIKNPITRSLAAAGMGAATGAPIGAVNGALTAAPGQEGQGAVNGATAGAVMGGAAPALSYGAGQAVKGAAVVAKTLARAANKAAGGQLLDPMRVAAQRLAEAMKADKVDPDTARTIMNQWLTSGVKPALLDVVPQGGNTQALLRGSTMTGDGRMIAKNYAAKVAADTQDQALALTRRLTPDNTQTAAQHEAELTATRATQAKKMYEAPYAQQVAADPVLPVLTGPSGGSAASTAYLDAEANKLNPAIADRIPELAKLKGALAPEATVDPLAQSSVSDLPTELRSMFASSDQPDGPMTVSLGTLDRLKIALNHMGESEMNGPKPNPSRAQGYFDLAGHIDNHLATSSPEYSAARDAYAANSRPIDAVQLGSKAMQPGVNPIDYADQLAGLGDGALPSAQVGLRSDLEQRIGAPAEGSTGVLNRIATGTNPTQILGSTFGSEAAQGYQAGIGNVVDKLNNARFIDQSTGSQTAGRLADLVQASAVHAPPTTLHGAVFAAINKIRQGATLTDAEKAAIAHFGTSDAQSVIPQISNVTSTPAQIDNWLTQHLATVAPQGGLLGSVARSNQSSQ